ncbi:MAG: hypothetical protein RRY54_02330 [Angelakisella sp.]
MMDYKASYSHMLQELGTLTLALEASAEETSSASTALALRRLIAECEEIRLRENPYPIHRAPRCGSSMK